ncbi:MAG: hypothetical protein ACYTEX_11080 [Planctomycetota bacterium]|jgi:hypothetical protein
MKVYVASSWRNELQQPVVKALREAGHIVYDFRDPTPGNHGFHWREIDPNWGHWKPFQMRDALNHPLAVEGHEYDRKALEWCDACVLVLPSGRSSHLELGLAIGWGKITTVLLSDGDPEFAYRLVDYLSLSVEDVVAFLEHKGGL